MGTIRQQVIAVGVVAALVAGGGAAWAEAQHEHEHGHEGQAHEAAAPAGGAQTLTGEVVDVFCYLNHPAQGLGKDHAACAKKCISSGLPVAIKVGDALYLASMADHQPANAKLAEWAGKQVTVEGTVFERDGQRLISISKVEPAR